jgi:uncharacterized protein YciI
MLYAILSEDIPNSLEKRQSARTAHIQRLKDLQNEGRLIIAGPHPAIDSNTPGDAGFTGSLVIAEFTDIQNAQTWANADPYLKAGAYTHVTTKPFKQVFPQ